MLEIPEREATDANVDVGDAVTAIDNDIDNADDSALFYLLSGRDAAPFTIDSGNGQISTSAALDYETKRSYSVTVTAVDPSGAFRENPR